MSAILEVQNDGICVLRVGGMLKKSEFDVTQAEMAKLIADNGSIRLLVLLVNFTGWARCEEWGDTDFFFSRSNHIPKIAVVGDLRWEMEILAFTGAGMRKGPVYCFPETAGAEARAWLMK